MSIDNNELDEMDFDLLDILGVTEQKVESITLLPGYNKKGEKEGYEELVIKSGEIVAIVGPTGSGKSSTLYSILKYKNKEEVNISTVEDPIEYQIEGINQVQCRNELGLDFIITDHHEIIGDLPKAFAVINPKREENIYSYKYLAGVGTAFMLIYALYSKLDRINDLEKYEWYINSYIKKSEKKNELEKKLKIIKEESKHEISFELNEEFDTYEF